MSICNKLAFCDYCNKECALNKVIKKPTHDNFLIFRRNIIESYFISYNCKYMVRIFDLESGELLVEFEVSQIQYARRYQEFIFLFSQGKYMESVALLDNGNTTCSYE